MSVRCVAVLAKNRQIQMFCLFIWGFSMLLLLVRQNGDGHQDQTYSADYILQDDDVIQDFVNAPDNRPQSPVLPARRQFDPDQPKYVILLAYQRVGSTFLGQVFNQNPDAMYVFEPLDAVYSAMYGTNPGWNIPSDIFTFSKNATLRPIPEAEHVTIQQVLWQLLSCNISSLPHQLLLHPFWKTWRKDYKFLAKYAQCVRALTGKATYCYQRALINQVCPERFGDKGYFPSYRCRDRLSGAESSQGIFHDRYLVPIRECLAELQPRYKICQPMFTEACSNSTLRGIKTVRMTMETASRMIDNNPNIRVVQLIRDPHGVAKSRMSHSSFQGLASNQNVTAEARLYCQTVLRDVITRKRTEAKHPGSTLQVIYEHFIDHPYEVVGDIYKLLDSDVPEAVLKWLDGQIADIKVNSTVIARRWRETQSEQVINSVYDVCSEFYQLVDFNWS